MLVKLKQKNNLLIRSITLKNLEIFKDKSVKLFNIFNKK